MRHWNIMWKFFHVLCCSISPASINYKCQVQSFISRTEVFAKGCIWPVPASSKMSQFTSLSLLRRKYFLFIRKLRLFPARIFRLTLKKLPAPFYPTTQTKNLPINIFSQNVQMRNLRIDPLIIIWKTSAWVQASPWSFLWGFLSILQVRFQSLNFKISENFFLEYGNDKKSIAWLLLKPGKRGSWSFSCSGSNYFCLLLFFMNGHLLKDSPLTNWSKQLQQEHVIISEINYP